MQGNWNHGQSYYRCRYPAEYALANDVDHPKTVYLREADVLPSLDAWLAVQFGGRLEETARVLADYGQEPKDGIAESLKLRSKSVTASSLGIGQHLRPVRIRHWSLNGWLRRKHSEFRLGRS